MFSDPYKVSEISQFSPTEKNEINNKEFRERKKRNVIFYYAYIGFFLVLFQKKSEIFISIQ